METGATGRRLLRLSMPPSAPTLHVGTGSDRARAPDINRSRQGSRGGSPNASRERGRKQNVSWRRGTRRSSKGESGKSRSNAVVPGAGIASQVNVVQKPQRQRAHSDAGGQREVIWPKEVDELMRRCKLGNAEPTAGWGTTWNESWNNPNYQELSQQQQENRNP